MESITIRVDKRTAREIDKAMKNNYSTKSEFVREAVRDKIKEINERKILTKFENALGKVKKITTYGKEREIRDKISQDLLKELRSL